MNGDLTDQHAIRLYDPNINPPYPPRPKPDEDDEEEMEPKEGPGDIGSTGFGERASEVPAPGGGVFAGAGGMAPPFAPGGPENPYPPSAGMPPNPNLPPGSEAYQPGFIGSGAPGSVYPGSSYPGEPPQPHMGISATGGVGAEITGNIPGQPGYQPQPQSGLPGHGTTPGQFQPGGGPPYPMQPKMPQAGRMPQQYGSQPQQNPQQAQQAQLQKAKSANPRSEAGFLARITPIEGGSPTHPIAPIEPGEPGEPVPPDQGGSVTQGKPRGLRILPMPKDKQPPDGPPKPPGQWVTVNAGKGQPPAYGYLEKEDDDTSEDTGLEPAPKKKSGTASHGAGTLQSGTTGTKRSGEGSGSENEQKGHYVPVLLPGKEPKMDEEPTWCWIPEISMEYGVKDSEDSGGSGDKPQPKPA